MTDGNPSSSTNGVALTGVLDGRAGHHTQTLQHLPLKVPRSRSSPEHGPKPKLGALDQHSLKSVDSGIPTLEISNPEPVPCSAAHGKRKQTGYDAVRLCGLTSSALSRSDDVSVCSVSSLGTELSTTLSVSNEDILDLVVTSSSSAIVTLENDDDPQFTDVTLSSIKETPDPQRRDCVDDTEEGSKSKILGPFSNFFTRNLLARKQNARLDKQNDLGWKLFGKLPLRENAQKDSKKIQKRPPAPAGSEAAHPSVGEGTGSGAGQACGISSPLAPGAGWMPAAGGMSSPRPGGTPARTQPGSPACQHLRPLLGRVPAACCLPSTVTLPPSSRAPPPVSCSPIIV
ncbi:TBC1 domain family member 14 [Pteropus alecto]|uniref:TBC1 domain family member 14 n=1 Tax=Pteropus alecto TaxID=9402 RepID=L5K6X0_PTEAL|nr:TBC1 domain family member 14 [Pteropus alecto]